MNDNVPLFYLNESTLDQRVSAPMKCNFLLDYISTQQPLADVVCLLLPDSLFVGITSGAPSVLNILP